MIAIVVLHALDKNNKVYSQELWCREIDISNDAGIVYYARLQTALREAVKSVVSDYKHVYGEMPVVASVSVTNQ